MENGNMNPTIVTVTLTETESYDTTKLTAHISPPGHPTASFTPRHFPDGTFDGTLIYYDPHKRSIRLTTQHDELKEPWIPIAKLTIEDGRPTTTTLGLPKRATNKQPATAHT